MPTHLNIRAQFAHLYMAGLGATRSERSKERKWTAEQLIAEADRKPGNARHVANPLPPNWLKGSGHEVLKRAEQWHAQAREAGGKAKRRVTSPCLAAAVVSWPREREAEWERYRDDVIAYFLRAVGEDRVTGVVEHLDESHQHLHIYFVSRDGEDFGEVHPGYGARARARSAPGNRVRTAYTSAMQKWQDDLYTATGAPNGLSRVGDRRLRLSRTEYVARTESAKLKAKAQAEAERMLAEAKAKAQEADEYMTLAKAKLQASMEKAKILKYAQQRFEATPAGEHVAELARRDRVEKALREELETVKKELDAAQFRVRAYADREASRSLRSPSPKPRP